MPLLYQPWQPYLNSYDRAFYVRFRGWRIYGREELAAGALRTACLVFR
jgi:hypothetical protein